MLAIVQNTDTTIVSCNKMMACASAYKKMSELKLLR